MSDEKKPKIEKLELNRETVADLTDEEAEGVQGGLTLTCAGCATADCNLQNTMLVTCRGGISGRVC